MVRDLDPGAHAAQMLSTLISIMMIAPLVGPLMGGQILRFAGWRDVFWVITGFGVVALLASLTLAETLAAGRRKS
jgi:DHA1 family bicyclomycin/chloramphenicol resistance-like MFS transporter